MRTILLALVLLLAGAQQHPAMPPEGNPGHQEPVPGAVCVHAGPGVDEGSACHCEPKCMDGHDQEGNADGTQYRQEDPKCRAYCFKTHCSCQSNCEP